MNHRTNTVEYVAAQRGFTLMEVLVALLILSFGLLGLAALQGSALKGTHGASLVSQASLLAQDMADRIRANPGQAAYDGFESDCPDPMPDTPLVDVDLAEWSCAVAALLPAGAGTIDRAAVGAVSRYTITVEWRDSQVDDAADPWDFQLVVDI